MTRSGWMTAVVGVVLVVLGFTLGWPPLALLGAGCLVLSLGALTLVVRRPEIRVERQIEPARVQKDGVAIAFLHASNRGSRSASAAVATQPFGEQVVATVLPRLRRGEQSVRACRLPTDRRGVFAIGPVEITRQDPFGMVSLSQRQAGDDQLLVTPRVVALHPLPTGVTRHIEGPSSDTAPQGTITFHRLREYVQGDDLRLIHWKSTARTGQLMVRHNVDTSQPYTVVVLDVRPSVHSDATFETALDVAASVAVASSVGQAPVQLRGTDGVTVGGPRHRDANDILDHLTLAQPSEVGTLRRTLEGLRRARGGTAAVIVTGRLDPADLPAAAVLRRGFQRVVVISVASAAAHVPPYPGLSLIRTDDLDELARAWALVGR